MEKAVQTKKTVKTTRAKKVTTGFKPRGDFAKRLAALIKAKGGTRAHGSSKTVSDATADKRWKVLFAGFRTLRTLDYKLACPEAFRGRHMQALVDEWVKAGLSASSIQNRVSIFRSFGEWIGKKGMVEASAKYVTDPAKVRRTSVATKDKSWTGNGVDPIALITKVGEFDARIGAALELQLAFGLRVRESLIIKPNLGDMGAVLDVYRGTKNGRRRILRIETEYQRIALERAKAVVQSEVESIAGPVTERNYTRAHNRFRYVMQKFGICGENGITPHGLRHENAQAVFARWAGYAAPVCGGPVPMDPAREAFARLQLAEHLGHSRPGITTNYVGRAKKNDKGVHQGNRK